MIADRPHLQGDMLERSAVMVRESGTAEHLENGLMLADVLADLNMDLPTVVAGLTYWAVRADELSGSKLADQLNEQVAHLVVAMTRMANTSLLEMSNAPMQTIEERDQVENVRRMLVSLIDDARVAVLKLAERLVMMRLVKTAPMQRRQRIAREAHLVFAPLAARLGIWQLKWELEDLALRYLEPDVYKAIAKQLDGRRREREQQIAHIVTVLEDKLRQSGIDADVSGRAKHIFSIYRKMRTKDVGLAEVYDVRAVRILVPDIAQCYATLGVVHTQWQHIPSEFDDYIAAPKENGYRSIHTAVMGPEGKTLEVQIRTREMHQEAELGVCAHWAYKHGEGVAADFHTEKMNWLRQAVAWQDDAHERRLAGRDFDEEMTERPREERIFVYTPKGHVLDLTTGATPVDFAYRVHTEIGHRCCGARVDGRPVSLNARLETGQRVEIITSRFESPERLWLNKRLGYVCTARAREKIQDWFRERPDYENRAYGIALISDTMARLGVGKPESAAMAAAARRLGFGSEDDLARALALGECVMADVVECLFPDASNGRQLSFLPHGDASEREPYTVVIEASDRDGLLRDITALLSEFRAPLVANSGRVDHDKCRAHLTLVMQLSGLRDLSLIIERLCQVPDVVDARRLVT